MQGTFFASHPLPGRPLSKVFCTTGTIGPSKRLYLKGALAGKWCLDGVSVADDISGLGSTRSVRQRLTLCGDLMRRSEALQGVRVMRFLDILGRYETAGFNQMEAAELLGVDERTFRRWRQRFEDDGEDGLLDRRLGKASSMRVPADQAGRGRGFVPRALTGLHGQTFSRASDGEAQLLLGLHPRARS